MGRVLYMTNNYELSKKAFENIIANLNEESSSAQNLNQINEAKYYLRKINKELFFRE